MADAATPGDGTATMLRADGQPVRILVGDDYVTKPFSLQEVMLRLRALLRRTRVTEVTAGSEIVVGKLVLDEDSRDVTRAGEPIQLTTTEFELLR